MKSINVCNSGHQGQSAPTTKFRKLRKIFGLAIAVIGLSASIMSAQAVEYVAASGGTVTTYNSLGTIYTVHTFTGNGTFTVTSGGTVNYLVIGGGGGGGSGTGGGGGAGGFLESTATVTGGSTAYTVTVGTGGVGGTANTGGSAGWGATGNLSAFGSFATADGGGGGAPNSTTLAANGNAGGSGGGGSWGTPGAASTGGAATSGQGNAGGACLDWGGPYAAGGGGGAGAVGVAGNKQNPGAAGGAGKASTITGTSTTYAGGGGGGAYNTTGGTGGTGGGGNGGNGGGGATAGAANKGSGGGGQGGNKNGAGAGGSGIVIIAYASGVSANPTSTSAALTALENVATALEASNFDYFDPNSSALANVQITSLPALGTLYLSGTAVTSGDLPLTVAAANITNLTYTSAVPTFGTGTAYTTIGIKVQNSTSLWSDPAVMTVNVTPTLPVLNGGFEDPFQSAGWATIGDNWVCNTTYGRIKWADLPIASPTWGGDRVANLNDPPNLPGWDGNLIWQSLGSQTFNMGATISFTFSINKGSTAGGVVEASFLVGATTYSTSIDTTAQSANGWKDYTVTQIIPAGVTDTLKLQFKNISGKVAWLDNVSNVSVTQSAIDPDAPLSTDATLTVLEDVETALAESNFGYSDPNSDALAAVQITALPALGTLKLSGTPVVIGDLPLTVAAANIGTLTYLAATNANGAAYTMIGIKVENSTGHWSIPASMTVNVTAVNDAPTSTGGSMVLRKDAVKAFATSDFLYSDVEGSPLSAVKVTSLPTDGTLKLDGVSITTAPSAEILVADIGTLTYTPTMGYTGADAFNFQVSDGTAYSTDAAMAITVTTDIMVQNGSFETPGANNMPGYWAGVAAPWTHSGGIWGQVNRAWGTTLPDNGGGTWVANFNDEGIVITQPLGSYSFKAGDTLSVTFDVGRTDYGGGVFDASILVNGVPYSQRFDNTAQAVNTWVTETLTVIFPVAVTGDFTLQFSSVSGRVGELDKVSNVSVTAAPPGGTIIIIW